MAGSRASRAGSASTPTRGQRVGGRLRGTAGSQVERALARGRPRPAHQEDRLPVPERHQVDRAGEVAVRAQEGLDVHDPLLLAEHEERLVGADGGHRDLPVAVVLREPELAAHVARRRRGGEHEELVPREARERAQVDLGGRSCSRRAFAMARPTSPVRHQRDTSPQPARSAESPAARRSRRAFIVGAGTARRWLSTQYAHSTRSHCACPTQAMASTLGGGAPRRLPAWMASRKATRPANAQRPTASAGAVRRAYSHAPAAKSGTSIAHRQRRRVPRAQAHDRRGARGKREVGRVDHGVEQPSGSRRDPRGRSRRGGPSAARSRFRPRAAPSRARRAGCATPGSARRRAA